MQTTKQMSLAEAMNELTAVLDQISPGGLVQVGGLEVKPGDPVALEIEADIGDGKGELEFEIKWPYLPPVTVSEALSHIAATARELQSGVVEIRGKTFPIGGPVEADIDIEGTQRGGELEWELSWPATDGLALDAAASRLAEAVGEIQEAGVISFGGKEIGMTELVSLRIEAEGDAAEGELEVEVNWPHIPERSLAEAVQEVRSILAQLGSGVAYINGKDVHITGPVEIDIELSGDDSEGEMELKISW
ncbi:MAG: amphi-Trp domain-containing protein [Dehalococcoidia bacterium]